MEHPPSSVWWFSPWNSENCQWYKVDWGILPFLQVNRPFWLAKGLNGPSIIGWWTIPTLIDQGRPQKSQRDIPGAEKHSEVFFSASDSKTSTWLERQIRSMGSLNQPESGRKAPTPRQQRRPCGKTWGIQPVLGGWSIACHQSMECSFIMLYHAQPLSLPKKNVAVSIEFLMGDG